MSDEDDLDEEYIFIHNSNSQIKLQIPDKKSIKQLEFNYLNDEIFTKKKEKNTETSEFEEFKKIQLKNNVMDVKYKIHKFMSNEDMSFNRNFMENIYKYAVNIGYENTKGVLFPVIKNSVKNENNPIIISSFLKGFKKFLELISLWDTDHSFIINELLPLMEKILTDIKQTFNIDSTINCFGFIINLLTQSECDIHIIPFLTNLAKNQENMIGQKSSMSICNNNLKFFSKKVIETDIIPLYELFSESSYEDLRAHCIRNIGNFFENVSYEILENKLIPIIKRFSEDSEKNIRKMCCDILPNICKISDKKLINDKLLPIYLNLINDKEKEIKTSAFVLIGKFLSYLDKEESNVHKKLFLFFESYTIENLNEKITNDIEKIIKDYIQNLECILNNISYEMLENQFIPIYEKLSNHENKIVKIMCCDILPNICKISEKTLIKDRLLKIYFNLIKDKENDVKTSALIVFSDFISYLDKDKINVNNELLTFYKNHMEFIINTINTNDTNNTKNTNDTTNTNNINNINNINDTNITSNINNDNDNDNDNNNNKNEYTLKILAQNFGKICFIFNEQNNENILEPLISKMYNSKGIEIKKVIIGIIPDYLTNISNKKIKNNFLSIFKDGYLYIKDKTCKHYRDKLIYIKGIRKLSKLYDNDIIFQSLLKIVVELCFGSDYPNIVKAKAAKTFSLLASKILITNNEEKKEIILKIIKMFAYCKKYQYRKLFIYICSYLIENIDIFMEYIFDYFYDVSYDNVSNVRVTMSRFLNKKWNKGKEEINWIKNNYKILEIINRLKNDTDKDVKESLNGIDIGNTNSGTPKEMQDVSGKFICNFEGIEKIFGFIPEL